MTARFIYEQKLFGHKNFALNDFLQTEDFFHQISKNYLLKDLYAWKKEN